MAFLSYYRVVSRYTIEFPFNSNGLYGGYGLSTIVQFLFV